MMVYAVGDANAFSVLGSAFKIKKGRVIEMKSPGNFRQGSRQTKEKMRGTDYKEADEN